MICKNLTVVSDRLLFAGRDLRALADKYGTPLYLMDEERIREKCRIYRESMLEAFGENAMPVYASKACSFRRMYAIMQEEKMGIEVVSPGEIHTAKSAGADLSQAYFNGNNKTDADVAYAMDCGVGYFVVDNEEEIDAIGRIATDKGMKQKVLLRITPGIDTHTYEAIQTGQVDSKFGSAIETGQAMAITKKSLATLGVELVGFHCHVGSLVFDSDTFLRSAAIMFEFMNSVREETGFVAEELSLEELSSRFYLSQTHLNRIFRASTGTTVWQYITIKRLYFAKELLETGKKPTEVAPLCGFKDYTTFFRAYKKLFGFAPGGR